MNPTVKQEGEPDGEGGADRYFCPYPGCKRSFAELWRLKVHYRAPPDIRGSGKERGHGTELSHCPKCGKGLKPGKHHVGCSGGKTAPRQAKRAKLAANGGMLSQDAMLTDPQTMYGGGMMLQGGYGGPGMQGPAVPTNYNQLHAFNQQYQPMQQQFQPDMSSYYSMQNPAQTQQMLVGGLMQQQQVPLQPQPHSGGSFSSPVLGLGLMDSAAANGQLGQSGSGDMSSQTTQYYHQQQQPMQQLMPLQQQPQQLMAVQQPQMLQQTQQQDFLQSPAQQQQHQQPPHQQPNVDLLSAPQQVQQQQHSFTLHPPIKQESLPSMSTVNTTYMPPQPQQQQLTQTHMVGQMPEQGYAMTSQDAAAAGLMPPPPPVPLMQLQQQQHAHHLSLQHQQQQPPVPQHHQQQQQPNAAVMPPLSNTVIAPPAPLAPPSPPPGIPAMAPIRSTLFDEIDNVPAAGVGESGVAVDAAAGGQSRAPSPPPLPPDFPVPTSGMGTLFNFSQFSQKLPAARGPSQQMAMMPRGMEQELPPSMDDLWTPEATYDHHSEGDLMQLLFGAPEQPPTMATIHLHHFLEDDACSSPLLTGLLGGSMDDLKAAEANHGAQQGDVAGTTASDATVQPSPYQDQKPMILPPAVDMQQRQLPAVNNNAVLPHKAEAPAGAAEFVVTHHGLPHQSVLLPGSNGVINGQYGAAVHVQMQMQMHMQMRNHASDGAPGMLPIKAEEGCLLKAGVPSIPEAVASRAT